jgi:DEAD/DEAH box helicase domain-containing protein
MLLGTVDEPAAFETVHPGAVYLHGGDSYVVTRLDIEQRVAYVERTDVNYYTTPGNRTDIRVKQVIKNSSLKGIPLTFGEVTVSNQVTHYWRKQLFTERVIDKVLLNLPEVTMDTQAVWLVLPAELTDSLVNLGYDLAGSIHAIEHASIGILPLFALCDRNDIGGVSHPGHPDVESKAVIFIYDGYAGGVGLARAAFGRFEELLTATLETIEGCQCKEGCPSCIQSPKCGNNNEPLDKAGAVFILSKILNRTSKTSERDYIRGVPD